ncbi:hypothetical protein A2U01_0099378, partial [Trifolium medium]|nr:hypothetical protein [Trifolium medium]
MSMSKGKNQELRQEGRKSSREIRARGSLDSSENQ